MDAIVSCAGRQWMAPPPGFKGDTHGMSSFSVLSVP